MYGRDYMGLRVDAGFDSRPRAVDQVVEMQRLAALREARVAADAPVAGHVSLAEHVVVAPQAEQVAPVEQAA